MTSVLTRKYSVPTRVGPKGVTLGVIDEDSRWAYLNGQCHALAMSIHEATGWPLWMIGHTRYECGDPDHWAVATPDGRLLDIAGAQSVEHMVKVWGHCQEADRLDWEGCQRCCYSPADLDAADLFVSVVTRSYVPEYGPIGVEPLHGGCYNSPKQTW